MESPSRKLSRRQPEVACIPLTPGGAACTLGPRPIADEILVLDGPSGPRGGVCVMAELCSMLTVSEVAERFKISKSTVWRRIRSGQLPHHRPLGSRLVRVKVEDLDALEAAAQTDGVVPVG
jgi:excisionase family DNA binding protein